MGYHLNQEEIKEVFLRFKDLADKKKNVSEADLEALVGDELYQPVEAWELLEVQVHSGSNMTPTAVVKLRDNATGEASWDHRRHRAVDAVYKSINQVVQVENNLVEYLVQAITEGMDANGDVTIRIEVPDSRGYKETRRAASAAASSAAGCRHRHHLRHSAKAYMQALE